MRRHELVARLRCGETFDLLVVGGGSTGTGIALDAATRGLHVALVERADFAAGTSSRSTKLLHGGVRYLEQAVKQRDRAQLALVREALAERATLLRIAPHLTRPLALVTPVSSAWERLYYHAGLLLYDALAGKRKLGEIGYLRREQVLRRFPALDGTRLRGVVRYHDAQFDDARMNVALALTAIHHGAVVVNYAEVCGLTKIDGRVRGAQVHDILAGERFAVAARAVVNATGPFTDALRAMDEPFAAPLLRVSMGIHLVVDQLFDGDAGVLIPRTDDGRVLFLLPWLGRTLIGTTDEPAAAEAHPTVPERQIAYLLHHVNRYLRRPLARRDVRAAWAGLRPLVAAGGARTTAALTRDHVVVQSSSGLVTVTGGKWTTYRLIARDAVDHAIAMAHLSPLRGCITATLPLVGAAAYCAGAASRLTAAYGVAPDVAEHLHRPYGDRADAVARLARQDHGARLAPGHPYVEAEVLWAAREELAQRALDVLARRTRLAFLDTGAAEDALPRVVALLGEHHGWDAERRDREQRAARERLRAGL